MRPLRLPAHSVIRLHLRLDFREPRLGDAVTLRASFGDAGNRDPSFGARPPGQDRILPNLSPALGARRSRNSAHPAACRTTDRILREPAAGLYRAPTPAQHHVQRGALSRPCDDKKGSCRAFQGSQSRTLGGRSKGTRGCRKKIYEGGLLDAGVPPCAICHGPEAKGNGIFPRLAGQLHEYIISKLLKWTVERGQDPAKQDTSAIMKPIAHTLTREQIEAVAAYLNDLE